MVITDRRFKVLCAVIFAFLTFFAVTVAPIARASAATVEAALLIYGATAAVASILNAFGLERSGDGFVTLCNQIAASSTFQAAVSGSVGGAVGRYVAETGRVGIYHNDPFTLVPKKVVMAVYDEAQKAGAFEKGGITTQGGYLTVSKSDPRYIPTERVVRAAPSAIQSYFLSHPSYFDYDYVVYYYEPNYNGKIRWRVQLTNSSYVFNTFDQYAICDVYSTRSSYGCRILEYDPTVVSYVVDYTTSLDIMLRLYRDPVNQSGYNYSVITNGFDGIGQQSGAVTGSPPAYGSGIDLADLEGYIAQVAEWDAQTVAVYHTYTPTSGGQPVTLDVDTVPITIGDAGSALGEDTYTDARSGYTSATQVTTGAQTAAQVITDATALEITTENQGIIDSVAQWADGYLRLNWDNQIFDKFPFCLPKDMYLLICAVTGQTPKSVPHEIDEWEGEVDLDETAPPSNAINGPPVIRVPVSAAGYDLDIEIDLSEYQTVIDMVRTGIGILFLGGLIASQLRRKDSDDDG